MCYHQPTVWRHREDGIEKNFPAEMQTRETADLFLQLIIEVLADKGRAAVVLPDGTVW
jgi:type I restriction enzyme M protein